MFLLSAYYLLPSVLFRSVLSVFICGPFLSVRVIALSLADQFAEPP
jgi:hypothetical protein